MHAPRLARVVAVFAMLVVALVETPSAGRSRATRGDALPTASERLARPVWLRHCGMSVVEWRSTAALKAETTPAEQAYAVLDDTCRGTFDRYADFLRWKKLPRLRDRAEVLPAISLLPGNVLLDGKSPRALNDLPSRFEAVAPGCCYWGLYVDSLNHLFLRNDPLAADGEGHLVPNPRFIRTLTHEISHILSARLGVWDLVGYETRRDEDLAEDFVAYMGMHFPAESSAQDLELHRGHTLPAVAAAGVTTRLTPPADGAEPGSAAKTSPQR